MPVDFRMEVAKYCDRDPRSPGDIEFYQSQMPSPEATVLKLVMRYYYPEQFEEIVLKHGFRIVNRRGGYKGERYGEGPELVLQFRDR